LRVVWGTLDISAYLSLYEATYASLESHSELAVRRGTAVELVDRVTVVVLCSAFVIWFQNEKSQWQS
jgi:hypothetical protein